MTTHTVTPVMLAAQTLSAHFPKADRLRCLCGAEWHPLHLAEELDRAGLLVEEIPR